jgi:hypothetical protein
VDGAHEDLRLHVVAQLDDQLGQIGLDGPYARGGQRLVELDLVGGDRLDLHHLVAP